MFASNFRLNLKAAGKGVSAKLTRNYCNRLGNSIPGLCFLWKNPHFRLEWKIPEDAIWVSSCRFDTISKQNVFPTNNYNNDKMRSFYCENRQAQLLIYNWVWYWYHLPVNVDCPLDQVFPVIFVLLREPVKNYSADFFLILLLFFLPHEPTILILKRPLNRGYFFFVNGLKYLGPKPKTFYSFPLDRDLLGL